MRVTLAPALVPIRRALAPTRHALVPILALSLAGSVSAGGEAYDAYRVASRAGVWIDGLEGRIEATGRIRMTNPVEPGSYEGRIIKDGATENARALLMAAVAELRIDGERLLGQDAETMPRMHALIAALEPKAARFDQGLYAEVDLVLPLRGLSGILGMILERGLADDQPGQNGTPHEGGATGLIVDAQQLTGADAAPVMALLPRIVDEAGRVVHDIAKADTDLARERGLVAYARESHPGAAPRDPFSRTGDRPLRVPAVAAGGAGRTDIVIRSADADRILEAAASSSFLKDCRVTVLMPPPPPPPAVARPRHPPERHPADPNTLH